MVILPAYYAASLNADPEQVIQYYVDICDASPVGAVKPRMSRCELNPLDPPASIQLSSQRRRPGHVVCDHRGCYEKVAQPLRCQTHVSFRAC
jgi:hypothetical protein